MTGSANGAERNRTGMIAIDISVEAGDWPEEETLRSLAERAIGVALAEIGAEEEAEAELSLLFTDDAHMRALNRQWRGKDKSTNVLSFPASGTVPGDPLPPILGDIVLARETVISEAALDEMPFEHHLIHLIVHGLLHLVGHDHEDGGDAERMEALERAALARLAIPDPYR